MFIVEEALNDLMYEKEYKDICNKVHIGEITYTEGVEMNKELSLYYTGNTSGRNLAFGIGECMITHPSGKIKNLNKNK